MDPLAALGPLPRGLRAEVDEGHLLVYKRLDLLHLDADALHDRLDHWTRTDLAHAIPAARAYVSFRHARPADPHEASTMDLQEGWLDMEATLALDLGAARAGDLARLAAQVPAFLKRVEGTGRPDGYRDPEVGAVE